MAYLEKRTGGWIVRWRAGGRGAPLQASEVLPLKADAQRRKALIESEQAQAQPIKAGVIPTWPELIARWGKALANAGRTAAYIESSQRRVARWSTTWPSANQIGREHLRTIAASASNLRVLRAFLRWCVSEHRTPIAAECLSLKAPRVAKRPSADLLDAATVQSLIRTAETWSPADGALAHLVATYGHRAESLVKLPCSALSTGQDGQAFLTLTVKGGDAIRHPLLPETATRLRALAAERSVSSPLFISHLKRPWKSGQEFASWFHHNIGKGRGYYDLKRFAITRMFDLGLDPHTIASITGHRTVTLLINTYARTNEARQQRAIQALSVSTQ